MSQTISKAINELSPGSFNLFIDIQNQHQEMRKPDSGTKWDRKKIFTETGVYISNWIKKNTTDQEFFKNHSIEIISIGNTLNLKITNRATREAKVLSIVVRLTKYTLSVSARNNLAKAGVVATKYPVSKKSNEYDIKLTDFYPNGSFEKQFKKKGLTAKDIFTGCAINITKMATRLKSLQNNNVFFPDAKTTNWLLDKDNNPVISDEKSLMTYDQARNNTEPFWTTPGYSLPEKISKETKDKDFENIHAYILGANIYDCLTGGSPPEEQLSEDHFTYPIFQDDIGQRYKELILNLTNPNPSERMGLDAAIKELANIKEDIQNNTKLGQRPDEIKAQNKLKPETLSPSVKLANTKEDINNKTKLGQRPDEIKAQNKLKLETLYPSAKKGKSNTYLFNKASTMSVISSVLYENNSVAKCNEFKKIYYSLKGDALKLKILANLQSRISQVNNIDELQKLKEEVMGDKNGQNKSPEFQVLEKYQGYFDPKERTKSHEALIQIFEDKADDLKAVTPNQPKTT